MREGETMKLPHESLNSALVLAPHTDDGEFGCGATIAKLCSLGIEVKYLAFSAAEESVPPGLPRDILRQEVMEATHALGLAREDVFVLKYPVRQFPSHRQEILEDLIEAKKNFDPSIVFCPSIHDIHQDHRVIAQEAIRAFKDRTILGYEMPWNNLSVDTTCFIVLSEEDVNKKVAALNCYMSQNFRNYVNSEFVYSLAQVRGTQVGAKYAEVFEVIRLVLT